MTKKVDIKLNIGIKVWILLLILLVAFCQYICCIPFNLHSFAFILELLAIVFIVIMMLLFSGKNKNNTKKDKILSWVLIGCMLVTFIYMFIGTPYTGGLGNYKDQIAISESDFSDIPQFDKTQVQLIDKNGAQQLGDRVFGTLGSDEVSQYRVGDDWVQISYNGVLSRVTPIDFGSLFKYFITKTSPGYLIVDCNSGASQLVRYEGMKYMKSAYFSHDLYRHLFFNDPTAIYGPAKFELDDQGKPYWIAPVYDVTWLGKTRDVRGIYICDPVDGKITYHDKNDVPAWVDNVYPVGIIYDQFRQSKKYENGLFNWSNKGVVEFTDDYAYVQFDNNVHIYTGVTSVGEDESNVGFAYVDLRDASISYIPKAGAEEYSARSSAEGALQQYHYTAIFPSMVNVDGIPTYFMGLVDGANLIKSYAFVSYENYQTVATGQTVEEAYLNYRKLTGWKPADDSLDDERHEFVVEQITSIVQSGDTLILYKDTEGQIWSYNMANNDLRASFVTPGNRLVVMAGADHKISEFVTITENE